MTRTTRRKPTRALATISLALLAASTSACISNRITVDASDGEVVARASALHVTLREDATEAAQSPTPSVASALRSRAEEALREKGYSITAAADADLILEITHRTEPVTRRTWSSDPDASAPRLVERTDAVLALRARGRSDDAEVWFCDARAPLPESGRAFAPSMDELWAELLEHALAKVPARRLP